MHGICSTCGGNTISKTSVHCPTCIDRNKLGYEVGKTKPPLGVMPRYIFLEKRCQDIVRAISAYYQFDSRLPDIEWVKELYELLLEIDNTKS